jgi:amino-acid N-acetyltransferase
VAVLTLSLGSADDVAAVRELLASGDLPNDDIADHIGSFILARDGRTIVGSIGVEILGETGLLRSLCVANEHRGRGIANQLCDRLTPFAREKGCRRLFLLTTTAKGFFERRGFEVVPRETAPPELQQTSEFRSLCPSTATCMTTTLENSGIGGAATGQQ